MGKKSKWRKKTTLIWGIKDGEVKKRTRGGWRKWLEEKNRNWTRKEGKAIQRRGDRNSEKRAEKQEAQQSNLVHYQDQVQIISTRGKGGKGQVKRGEEGEERDTLRAVCVKAERPAEDRNPEQRLPRLAFQNMRTPSINAFFLLFLSFSLRGGGGGIHGEGSCVASALFTGAAAAAAGTTAGTTANGEERARGSAITSVFSMSATGRFESSFRVALVGSWSPVPCLTIVYILILSMSRFIRMFCKEIINKCSLSFWS